MLKSGETCGYTDSFGASVKLGDAATRLIPPMSATRPRARGAGLFAPSRHTSATTAITATGRQRHTVRTTLIAPMRRDSERLPAEAIMGAHQIATEGRPDTMLSTTRREFLTTTAAVGAALAAGPVLGVDAAAAAAAQ